VTEPEDVSRRIRGIRRRLNLSQAGFGQKLGVKKLAVARYEAGRVPKLAMLNKIARLGGVTVSWLLASESTAAEASFLDVPQPVRQSAIKLLDELRSPTSTIWSSASLRRRYADRGNELLVRCRRDLTEYREMLEREQRRIRSLKTRG
jgi:transcriptional regulator with XRE-family HTH domain